MSSKKIKFTLSQRSEEYSYTQDIVGEVDSMEDLEILVSLVGRAMKKTSIKVEFGDEV